MHFPAGTIMTELLQQLANQVCEARADKTPLYIRGGDSKRHQIGRACAARQTLNISQYRGISEYQPQELVISARAGTPLGELEATLADQGQMLPFEPPRYGGRATLGGTLACNLSGPGRPWLGSIRDSVLGVQLINGDGKILSFGGKVMKNVAGYDVSRMQAGALGTLGVISEVHLKVVPLPEASVTLARDTSPSEALELMTKYAGQPKPLTGACWINGRLYLRLAGAASAVNHTAKIWGGDRVDNSIWGQLQDMSHPFFTQSSVLWRLATMPTSPCPDTSDQCIDWGGSQRWLRKSPEIIPPGAHLNLFSGGDRQAEVRGQLDQVQQSLQLRLKKAFDPAGILNPGRLYSWM